MKTPQPPCPECEKLTKVSQESQQIGAFLEWLGEKDVAFCKWNNRLEMFQEHDLGRMDINRLLATYYDIDLDIVEKERRALLEWIRKEQE